MSASMKLLHHHFHALHSFDTLRVKPTKIPASPVRMIYSQLSGMCLSRFPFHPGSGCLSLSLYPGKQTSILILEAHIGGDGSVLRTLYILLSNKEASVMTILKGANSFLPQVVIASSVLGLWLLYFHLHSSGSPTVGVNSSEKDFLESFHRPKTILAGYVGQFVVKPPLRSAAEIMLTSCVSGAQLSSYATFLTDPPMAPFSIVMTSLSTATAVFVTRFLSLLLIG